MVCDVTDIDSFHNIPQIIKDHDRYMTANAPIILVGTKMDLANKRTSAKTSIPTIKTI